MSRRRLDAADFNVEQVDAEGLPLVYNEAAIAAFWRRRPGDLAGRWAKFAAISAPWLTRLATAALRGSIERDQVGLARDAVENLSRLGPTWVKLGQARAAPQRRPARHGRGGVPCWALRGWQRPAATPVEPRPSACPNRRSMHACHAGPPVPPCHPQPMRLGFGFEPEPDLNQTGAGGAAHVAGGPR